MRKRFLAFVSLLVLALAALAGPASPAQANAVHACGSSTVDNIICLYQNVNYAAGRWQSSFQNIYKHPNNCLNIAPAQWSNGTPVNDNSAGLVVNGDPSPTNVWSYYDIYIFNWIDCNVDGGVDVFPGNDESSIPNLTCCYYVNHTNIKLYHTITSIELIPHTALAKYGTARAAARAYALAG